MPGAAPGREAEEAALVRKSGIELRELGGCLSHVLVAAAAEGEDVVALCPSVFEKPRNRMRRLERRDDPLQAGELPEGAQRLGIGCADVGRAAGVPQVGVLGPDARVVEPGGD